MPEIIIYSRVQTLVYGFIPLATKAAVLNKLEDCCSLAGSHVAGEDDTTVGGCVVGELHLHLVEEPGPPCEEGVGILLRHLKEQWSEAQLCSTVTGESHCCQETTRHYYSAAVWLVKDIY